MVCFRHGNCSCEDDCKSSEAGELDLHTSNHAFRVPIRFPDGRCSVDRGLSGQHARANTYPSLKFKLPTVPKGLGLGTPEIRFITAGLKCGSRSFLFWILFR